MVAFLKKPKGSEDFHQIVDFLTASHIRTLDNREIELNAIVDGQVKTITEAFVRKHLKLANVDGISTLPTTKIFEQFALMSPKKTYWEQFNSNIAIAIICLATNRRFNFSKLIFDGMVKNLENKYKFLRHLRFLQMILNKDTRLNTSHKRLYIAPSLTQKFLSNIKRESIGFFGVKTALFLTMLVTEQVSQGEGPTSPVGTQHTPTIIESSAHLQNMSITYRKTRTRTGRMGIRIPHSNVPSSAAYEAITQEMHDGLGRATTTASSLAAEQGSVIDSSEEEEASLDHEDSPRQGRMIKEIDKDKNVNLAKSKTLLNIKRSATKDKGKAIMFVPMESEGQAREGSSKYGESLKRAAKEELGEEQKVEEEIAQQEDVKNESSKKAGGRLKRKTLKAREYKDKRQKKQDDPKKHTLMEYVEVISDSKKSSIHMLVEKKYPLPRDTLRRMLKWKLYVKYNVTEMAYELLRFIREITSLGEDCWELNVYILSTAKIEVSIANEILVLLKDIQEMAKYLVVQEAKVYAISTTEAEYIALSRIMSSITAQQAKLDLKLVPKEKRLEIGNTAEDSILERLKKNPHFKSPEMKETQAYKTNLCFATGATPLKKAQKFKKPASPKLTTIPVPTEEPKRKSKRVKRPAKKSTMAPAGGVVIRETPKMPLSMNKDKVDVTRDDSNNEQDSSGEDGDQENDSDDDKTQSDNENKSDSKPKTNENESGSKSDHVENKEVKDDEEEVKDEFVKTTSNDSDDEDETKIIDKAEEGTDAAMTNVQQGNKNPEILQVIEDAHVTLSTVPQKTEFPVTSSSYSSDLAAKFLNFSDIPHTNAESVSPADVHVHHEVPSQQTPTLLTVHVSVISDSSPVFSIVIPQSLPSFTPPPHQSTSTPPPIIRAINPPSTLPNFASVFQFKNRVIALEKEVIKESLEDAVLAKESSQPQSSYEAATTLIEFKLKKILIDKMDKSESYLAAPEHRECYEGLIKSYDLEKTLPLDQTKGDKSQSKSFGKSVQSEELEFEVVDSDMPQDLEENPRNDDEEPKEKTPQEGQNQRWLMTHASSARKPLKTFDELMSTPIDFSAFIMNVLKINNLTQETLLGPTFKLLKGTHSNYAELEYDFEECYKDLSKKLDWENLEGGDYPFDLTKPLLLVMNGNHQKVHVEYFFNNDLKYLQGGVSTMTYTTSITKTKAAQYDLPGIEDMVPNIWVLVKVAYNKHAL
nr:hypothetical protein [Tanacetum cinerariifolium]